MQVDVKGSQTDDCGLASSIQLSGSPDARLMTERLHGSGITVNVRLIKSEPLFFFIILTEILVKPSMIKKA